MPIQNTEYMYVFFIYQLVFLSILSFFQVIFVSLRASVGSKFFINCSVHIGEVALVEKLIH